MEHRKDYGSPRDMLDDALLQRILADMNDEKTNPRSSHSCGCGQIGEERPSSTGSFCSCGRSHIMPRQEPQSGGCTAQNCVSGSRAVQLKGYPLAMVFSPNQEWEGIFEPEEALAKGTLFAGLVFPWYPSRCREAGSCGCGRD